MTGTCEVEGVEQLGGRLALLGREPEAGGEGLEHPAVQVWLNLVVALQAHHRHLQVLCGVMDGMQEMLLGIAGPMLQARRS